MCNVYIVSWSVGVALLAPFSLQLVLKMRLSVCICTLNEEEFIAPMIESMIDSVYELIILDGCSEDKTAEIIEGYQAHYGDKIKLFFWEQNHSRDYVFDEQARRDWTFDKANGHWILFTAPDEIFCDHFWRDLIDILYNGAADFYTFPRINCWKHPDHWRVDSYPDPQLRLFRKGYGEFSEGDEHGFIVAKNGQHGGEALRHEYLKDYPIYHFHWCSKVRPFDPFWCPDEAVVKKLEVPLPEVILKSKWYTEGGFPEKWK